MNPTREKFLNSVLADALNVNGISAGAGMGDAQ
jgi:hypothetical protein